MREDDETTACQLHALLNSKGYSLSLRTILQSRSLLGWTFRYANSILYTIIIIACIFNSAFIDLVNCLHIILINFYSGSSYCQMIRTAKAKKIGLGSEVPS